MAAYIHAENMLLFAQDAANSETPWRHWQVSESCTLRNGVWEEDWENLVGIPDWHPDVKYRRLPLGA